MTAVLLGPEAATSCPVKTVRDVESGGEVSAPVRAGGRGEPARGSLREAVWAALRSALGEQCVRPRGEDRVLATLAAMDAGARVVLDPELPPDVDGGRAGHPDLLVRVGEGYLPGLVRDHVTLDRAEEGAATVSTLHRPWEPLHLDGLRPHRRSVDLFELAHHTRILEASARHAGPYHGLVVGTSQHDGNDGDRPVLVWVDLTRATARDLARIPGAPDDSVLTQYDHEHAGRVEIARATREHRPVDHAAFPSIDVTPVGQEDCLDCRHGHTCRELLPDDDASVVLGADHLDVTEWRALRSRGITTVGDVAQIDLDDHEFVGDYVAELVHRPVERAAQALALTVARARMVRDGRVLERRTDEPLDVPAADVEIDTDVEWDAHGRVFLWGARVRQAQDDTTAEERPLIYTLESLDDAGERALADMYVSWLRELVTRHRAEGRTVAVFHWSHLEVAHLRRILGDDAVADLVADDGVYVDLRRFVEREFVVLGRHTLPRIAAALGIDPTSPTRPCRDVTGPVLDAHPLPAVSAAVRDELRRRFGA